MLSTYILLYICHCMIPPIRRGVMSDGYGNHGELILLASRALREYHENMQSTFVSVSNRFRWRHSRGPIRFLALRCGRMRHALYKMLIVKAVFTCYHHTNSREELLDRFDLWCPIACPQCAWYDESFDR